MSPNFRPETTFFKVAGGRVQTPDLGGQGSNPGPSDKKASAKSTPSRGTRVNWSYRGKFPFKDNPNLMGMQFKIQFNDFFCQIIKAMELSEQEKYLLSLGMKTKYGGLLFSLRPNSKKIWPNTQIGSVF